MTASAALSLFAIMIVLAALPSASVGLVVSRSMTHGFHHGAAVAAGIVLGDLIFVALAVLGMSTLAHTFGGVFAVFKYLGGAYLMLTGIRLLKTDDALPRSERETPSPTGLIPGFAAGLFLTLGDLKAIVFYASLFPTFVDLTQLSRSDVVGIALITIVAVGGIKLLYAYSAQRIVGCIARPKSLDRTRKTAGVALIGTGAYLIAKG